MGEMPFDYWFLESEPLGGLILPILILWSLLSLVVAKVARDMGRGAVMWFFVALTLSPLIGYLLAEALGRVESRRDHSIPLGSELSQCPACKEVVSASLSHCTNCGERLPVE